MIIDQPPAQRCSGTALVVEDDDDVRTLLRTHLERRGWDVRAAATGEDAVEMAQAHPPRLAIVDVGLPGMDGVAVVRALRADPTTSSCCVIMTSVIERDDILGLGTDALLTKPFTRRDVAQMLDTLKLEAPA